MPARHRQIDPTVQGRRYLLAVAVIVTTVLGFSGVAIARIGVGGSAAATSTMTSTSVSMTDRAGLHVSRDLARPDPSSPLAATASASPSPSSASPAPSSPAPRPSPALLSSAPSTQQALPAGCGQYSGVQLIACQLLPSFGFATSEMSALIPMWNRESGWNATAQNPSSGAYGIPQALPGDKMASVAADWRTNPATQIKWGLGYIKDAYGTPSAAWAFWQNHGWY